MPTSFPIVSVAEMRALEAAAVEAGTPELELQERAGRAVADAIAELLGPFPARIGRASAPARTIVSMPSSDERRVVALVGAGNNGRDAVVAARHLAAHGYPVEVWLWARHGVTDDEIAQLRGMGLPIHALDAADDGLGLRGTLAGADVVIDGLLGVGNRGPMRAGLAEVASAVNAARASNPTLRIVAVDVPSGLDADTGEAPGVIVRADATVTFGAIKAGLLRFPGAEYVGRLVVRPIGLPDDARDRQPVHALDAANIAALVPARPLDAHKYRFGRLLVVAGSDQYVGAACLGSGAAARTGCGLVGLVSTEAVKQVLAVRLPEATYPATLEGIETDPEQALGAVSELLPHQQALLIGPGIGRAPATDSFLRAVLSANRTAERPTPAVIDADALWLLGGWERWWEQIGPGNVLTPHAGELERLAGSIDDTRPPWETARRLAEQWGQVVVFKGPFTTVAAPSGRVWVWPRANPALATGGTGDVLAGLTAGLLAQGLSPFDAARLAVVVHALAAETLVAEREWRTLLASDLLDFVPRVMTRLTQQAASETSDGVPSRSC